MIFSSKDCVYKKVELYLQCVFHGIRFKVNKVGCRETANFFYIPIAFENVSGSLLILLRFYMPIKATSSRAMELFLRSVMVCDSSLFVS